MAPSEAADLLRIHATAHFFQGFTGLTVTILSIVTLFVLMQMTGRLRWSAPSPAAAPGRAAA